MDNKQKNLSDIGDQLKHIVQDAVDNNDFRQLSGQIQKTVNTALDSASDWIKNAGAFLGNGSAVKTPEKGAGGTAESPAVTPTNAKLFAPHPSGSITSQFQKIGGGILTFIFALCTFLNGAFLLSFLIAGNLSLPELLFSARCAGFWICLIFLLLSLILLKKGINSASLITRFRKYVRALQGQSFISLDHLSQRTGIAIQTIQKDIPKMLHLGMFRQGHLTEKEDGLIVTDATYTHYQHSLEQQRARQAETEAFVRSAPDQQTAREYARIVTEGNNWLTHIRHVNDQLPEQEISDKLDRLEQGVNRIFEEVKKQPHKAGELHKFMNYYLPTTSKLIDAYAELEREKDSQSTYVLKTKEEIKASLDTINTAFEKLFDKLFAERALDISTDISVLETMLAQEGLTKGDFETK